MSLYPYRGRKRNCGFFDNQFNPYYACPTDPQDMDDMSGTKDSDFISCDASNDDKKFVVKVDVCHFKPEEITVETVDNNVIINGKHKEKMDKHGWVERQFTRRYALPDYCDANKVQSSFNSEGILRVWAPNKVNSNASVIAVKVIH